MNRALRQRIKAVVPAFVIRKTIKYQVLYYAVKNFGGRHGRECPLCGFKGFFYGYGAPLRFDAACPSCRTLERHRQHFLLIERYPQWIDGARLLHFSPEPCFVDDYTRRAATYVRADYFAGPEEVRVDIQKMQFDDNSFDTIICHQIMEHVPDDRAAMLELYRVVRPSGTVLLSTPIIETWQTTYENPGATDPGARDLYFGQDDHVRFYGRNFRDLVASVGFEIAEDVASEPEVSRYGLQRGHVIFVCTKPPSPPSRNS
jgi:SAM-dependent methyltransferase